MNKKEVVQRAVAWERPPRIPYAGSLKSDVFPVMPTLPKTFQPTTHAPHVDGGSYMYKQFWYRLVMYRWKRSARKDAGYARRFWHESHRTVDEWGVYWQGAGTKTARDQTMGHPLQEGAPIGEWDDLDEYQIPDAADPMRYRFARSAISRYFKDKLYTMGTCGSDFFFTRCTMLRGFNQFLVDLGRSPKQVERLLATVLPYYLTTIEKLHENCPWLDCFSAADDWGSQHSAFISPRMFRRFFHEPYKQIVDLVHDLGMKFFLHSCGNIEALMPQFRDLGIDMMEFDSPRMTGLEVFREYAQNQEIFVWGCVDIQTVWPFASPAEVEEEVKAMIGALGPRDGGFGAYEYFNARKVLRVPAENVRAMREAAAKWGKYGPDGTISWLSGEKTGDTF
ncbi:MAG: uroporphyrinogen decarboxylase family protein [Promethearchaeota archaeon]